MWGGGKLTVVCAYASNSSSENSAFLETLNGVLYGSPVRNSTDLLQGDFNAHVGNDGDLKKCGGEEGLPDLNPISLFFDFCASHGLSIMNTMFEHKGAHVVPGNRVP